MASCTLLRSAGSGRVLGRGSGILGYLPAATGQSGSEATTQGIGEDVHTPSRGADRRINPHSVGAEARPDK
jgi:hypothetical protein